MTQVYSHLWVAILWSAILTLRHYFPRLIAKLADNTTAPLIKISKTGLDSTGADGSVAVMFTLCTVQTASVETFHSS